MTWNRALALPIDWTTPPANASAAAAFPSRPPRLSLKPLNEQETSETDEHRGPGVVLHGPGVDVDVGH
jgi:hypothetical protein